ncbi:DUF1822 family protein [Oscillatoria sp. FACHB-1407]|uniref:DUF1822 family protein n=1 Tax=Oscillatoria sp. FACHB-1407 TaxID=2692847 RepID=UPI0016846A52|nr:DUF1822 family protein [Oscillatoria sp. FACHB-1407]MBD2463043.1 DUF1822 family protein [Oscillatoria sp. FACHB-1407]
MMEEPFNSPDLIDWEPLSDESIEMSQEQIDRALQLSEPITKADQQWSVYLHALALSGFEQWLEEWAPDLRIEDTNSSLYQPAIASLVDAVCHLTVGRFKVCLIAVSSVADTAVSVPRAIVDLPDLIPHLYVLMEIKEEQMQVRVHGYLRYDQWLERQASGSTSVSDWQCVLPLNWFNPDSAALLLDLRYLDPATVPLPTVTPTVAPADGLQDKLLAALPQLRSPLVSPKQLLNWEELSLILTTPELAEWLYQAQQPTTQEQSTVNQLREGLSAIWNQVQTLGQQAINVGLWLQDQLDELAQELSWTLVPAFSPALAEMRSVQEELETVVSELQQQAVGIPPEARGAYRDLRWGNVALRLYVLTWALPVTNAAPEWTLLVVVSSQQSASVPAGVKLQVRDAWQVLVERTLTQEAPDSYLYAQVVGGLDEQFWVRINLNQGAAVTFCFAFNPERAV